MRCLILHCNRFSYTKEWQSISLPGDNEGELSMSIENALVVFVAVEAGDDIGKVTRAAKEIRKLANKNESTHIVVNPFAHLSGNLAPIEVAHALSKELASRLITTWAGSVIYSSFGWYKSYDMSVLSHSLSQLYREF